MKSSCKGGKTIEDNQDMTNDETDSWHIQTICHHCFIFTKNAEAMQLHLKAVLSPHCPHTCFTSWHVVQYDTSLSSCDHTGGSAHCSSFVSRENELLCLYFSTPMKYLMRTSSFVPKCTWALLEK